MSQSVLLPAFVGLFGIIAAIFLVGFTPRSAGGAHEGAEADANEGAEADANDGDDDYVEIILVREPPPRPGIFGE